MRRMVSALAVAATAVAVSGSAGVAGPPVVDDRGNVEMIDIEVSPPVASTRSRPQPVTLQYQAFTGNRNARPGRAEDSEVIRLPRGMRVNAALFPTCPLPTTAEQVGSARCSRAARLGSGATEVQVGDAFYPATVTIFNGESQNGRPTLIFRGTAEINGVVVASEYNFEVRRTRSGPRLATIDLPGSSSAGTVPQTRVEFRLGRAVTARRGTRPVRRGYLESPRVCRGSWRFSVTTDFDDGTRLTSTDATPCVNRARKRPTLVAGTAAAAYSG